MTEEEAYDLKIRMLEDLHDPDLSEALARWACSMDVKESHLIMSCLRLAALCVAKQLNRSSSIDDCVIIDTFADYFHAYVHVAQRLLKEVKEK